MDNREFVRLAKREAIDSAVKNILGKLNAPRANGPLPAVQADDIVAAPIDRWFNEGAIRQQRQAAWFASLDAEGQETLRGLLEECAELSGYGFFTLIDGVGGDSEGVFELVHVCGEEKTVLNPQNTDMLHDLFSEVCEKDRRGETESGLITLLTVASLAPAIDECSIVYDWN